MKRTLTGIAKIAIYFMALAVLIVCVVLLPEIAREEAVGKADIPLIGAFLIGVWILAVPIFVALYQAHKLLEYIEINKAFTNESIRALQNIKFCAILFSIMIILEATAVIIFARMADPTEDVTHIVTLGFVFTFTSTVIAVITSLLQKLLKDAINLKSENDLTV